MTPLRALQFLGGYAHPTNWLAPAADQLILAAVGMSTLPQSLQSNQLPKKDGYGNHLPRNDFKNEDRIQMERA